MIFIVPGVNSFTPIDRVIENLPYHICDIITHNPKDGYEINKELVKNSVSIYKPSIILGKSYGAWIISESISNNTPTFLFSIPLRDSKKSFEFPKIKNRNTNLICSAEDSYFDKELVEKNKNKYNKLLISSGDHSLRPVTKKKVSEITNFILTSTKKKNLGDFSKDYLGKRKRAKVSIVKKTDFYEEVPLHRIKRKVNKILRSSLDENYGPVTAIVKRKSPVENLFVYQSNILDTSKINSFVKNSAATSGIGVSYDEKVAIDKSIYEALERYSLTLSIIDFVEKKYEDIPPFLRLNKKELIFNTPDQKKKHRLRDLFKEKIHWTVIRSLIDNEEKLYPAQLIIPNELGYKIRETSSSGTALGTTKEQALTHGLKEVIERNSLMRWFYNVPGTKSRKIKLNKKVIPKKFLKLYLNYLKKGFHFNAYLIDFLGFNTIFLLAYNEDELYIGSSCGEFGAALNGAFGEILITSFFAKTLRKITPKKPNEIKNLPQHLLYYQGELKFKLLDYLDSISKSDFKVSKKKFNYIKAAKHLKKEGYETYYKDVTAPELRGKFFVEKVIVPRFLDVIKEHSLAWEGHSEIKKVPSLPTPFA